MKREFLEGLGLSKEVIDKVMAENGSDIESLKNKISELTIERDGAKEQLTKRDADIATLKKSAEATDALKTQLSALEVKYQQDTTELSTKLAKQSFDTKLELALTGKVKNVKAAKALLDIEKIQLKEDKLEGLDTQLETLRTSDSYLFVEQNPPKNPIPPRGNPPKAPINPGDGQQTSLKDAIAEKMASQFDKK